MCLYDVYEYVDINAFLHHDEQEIPQTYHRKEDIRTFKGSRFLAQEHALHSVVISYETYIE